MACLLYSLDPFRRGPARHVVGTAKITVRSGRRLGLPPPLGQIASRSALVGRKRGRPPPGKAIRGRPQTRCVRARRAPTAVIELERLPSPQGFLAGRQANSASFGRASSSLDEQRRQL